MEVHVEETNTIVVDKKYVQAPELIELIVSKEPDYEISPDGDYDSDAHK